MSTETRYRIATPYVIHEPLDDEVMFIHRAQGIYYSLSGSGPLLYEPLVAGASAGELVAALALQTDGDAATIVAAVARLLGELTQHGLIVAAPEGTAAPPAEPEGARAKRPFAEPRLEAFTELQDLLLADPVHDVEPSGWPNVKRP